MNIFSNKKQSGVILVLAVVLTGILFSVAITIAVIVISDLRQAGAIDRSIVAYYAADSGLERTLFALRKDHDDPSIVDSMETVKALFAGDELTGSESDWDINDSTDYERIFYRQKLFRGQSAKIYITGRKNNNDAAESIKIINWERSNDDPAIRLRATMTQLQSQPDPDNNGVLVYYTDTDKVLMTPPDKGGPNCLPMRNVSVNNPDQYQSDPDNFVDYAIELTALGDGLEDEDLKDFVSNLNITTYNTDDCSGDINPEGLTNITIVANGEKGDARQTIFAHILPRDPISGILGFVLFSEEDITKGY